MRLIDPQIVATLGTVALDAIRTIEPHDLTLKLNAGTAVRWNGRTLVPLYHPSPHVIALQRGLDLQLEHFQTMAKVLHAARR